MVTLADLPPELYTHVLHFVDTPSLSSTTLALTRAIPRSPVPQYHLFTHVRLTKKGQLLNFYLRIRGSQGEDARKYVQSFELREWKFDPDVLINTLQLLPDLASILIWIGYNCAPEHIAEIFARQRKPALQSIVLRFRTWTDHANYLPFLKGSYYDSTFEAVARSPPPSLAHFSVVQDVPTRDIFDHPDDDDSPSATKISGPSTLALLSPALRRNFAPPIVLFATSCLSSLTSSPPILASLKHLRLRFPQRQILTHLYPMPSLELLDLSSTTFSPADLRLVFIKFPTLKHLLIDHTGFFLAVGREGAADACREAGRICAMWGVGRAREVEREAKDWFASQQVRRDEESDEGSDQAPGPGQPALPAHLLRPAKKGRRGIASATISLRDRPATTSSASSSRASSSTEPTTRRMHVLPPLPALRTLSLGTSDPSITPAIRDEWSAQFSEGWQEGRRRLADFAKRHRPRADLHVYRLRPSTLSLPSSIPSCLQEVTEEEWEAYTRRQSVGDVADDAPVFCTVPDAECGVPARRGFGGGRRKRESDGESEDAGHLPGCGHAMGKGIWGE